MVIGAGYIGVEAADALRRNGLRVTVLERSAERCCCATTPDLTAAVRKQLERHGVELRCGVDVRAIEPDRVADVACDLVVIAAGFKPNVELAAEAGVEIGRTGAIRTDDRMETNLHGVFAAGDCAEAMHLVTGRPTWIPLGTTANKTGPGGRRQRRRAAASASRGVVGTSIVRHLRDGLRHHRPFRRRRRAPKVFRRWPRASKPGRGRAISSAARPRWNWWPTAPRAACWADR